MFFDLNVKGSGLENNLKLAYEYLLTAIEGYKHLIKFQNANYYNKILMEAEKLLQNSMFDEFKEK